MDFSMDQIVKSFWALSLDAFACDCSSSRMKDITYALIDAIRDSTGFSREIWHVISMQQLGMQYRFTLPDRQSLLYFHDRMK